MSPYQAPQVGCEARSRTVRNPHDEPAGGIVVDVFDRPDPDTGEVAVCYVTLDPGFGPRAIGRRHVLAAADVDVDFAPPDLYRITVLIGELAAEVAAAARRKRIPGRDELATTLATMTRLWAAAWAPPER